MAELTPYQRDILIKTVLGEARGEGVEGMSAVAHNILNRAQSGRFSSDPAQVALQPKQYSTWNSGEGGNNPQQFKPGTAAYERAAQIVDGVASGTIPDVTGGALYYHANNVSPSWSSGVNKNGTLKVGNHTFYPSRPVPPGEIPNVVASLTDTKRPAPTPATQTADLAQMRDPRMSTAARNAQVTPSENVMLPRRRPSAPDIVTPSMAALQRSQGNVNATRAVDMIASTANPVTPRLTPAGDNIYSYDIPGMAPTSLVGGMGSLTPMPQRQRLPEIPRTTPGQSQIERTMPSAREIASAPGTTIATYPTSGIGQPPITRSVPLVPIRVPTQAEIDAAPGAVIAQYPPLNMHARDYDYAGNRALGQRVASQMGNAFAKPAYIPTRLTPRPIVQPQQVALNQPPLQIIGGQQRRIAPVPMSAGMRPQAPMARQAVAPIQQQRAPLRVVVQGGNYAPVMIPQQRVSPAQAYAMANAKNYQASVEDRVSGRSSGSDGVAQSLSG